jgi:glycolate oxidase
MFTPEDLATMQLVRQAFDPKGLANPGKIFPTPARCGESQRRQQSSPTPSPVLQTMEVF